MKTLIKNFLKVFDIYTDGFSIPEDLESTVLPLLHMVCPIETDQCPAVEAAMF